MSKLLEMVKRTSGTLPEFNFDWILKFREGKFNSIIETMERSIREALELLQPSPLQYIGHHILTPEERIELFTSANRKTDRNVITNNNVTRSNHFEVNRNTVLLVRFEYMFEHTRIHSLVHIPFLKDHRVSYGRVDYYPELPIVEKCIHINHKKELLTVKVARAPLQFWRNTTYRFDGKLICKSENIDRPVVFREIIVTTKIHQGRRTKKDNTPILLYFLVNGWYKALDRLGFGKDVIEITCLVHEDQEPYYYFPVGEVYIKVKQNIFDADVFIRRFVAAVIKELASHDLSWNIKDVIDEGGVLWKLLLGRYVYINKDLIIYPSVVVDHTIKHLNTNRSLVDGLTRKAFKSLRLDIDNFDDLLHNVYFKIDEWFVNFVPSNLYEKRITFNPMFSGFERTLYSDVFKIIKQMEQKKREMQLDDARKFRYSRAYKPTWFNDQRGFFSTNPTRFNGNLLDVLLHRFILTDSDESGSKRKGRQAPEELQLAHPSDLTVTSITTVPSSSPIIAGSINPYISTDENDNIVVDPQLKRYVKGCFK